MHSNRKRFSIWRQKCIQLHWYIRRRERERERESYYFAGICKSLAAGLRSRIGHCKLLRITTAQLALLPHSVLTISRFLESNDRSK